MSSNPEGRHFIPAELSCVTGARRAHGDQGRLGGAWVVYLREIGADGGPTLRRIARVSKEQIARAILGDRDGIVLHAAGLRRVEEAR